MQHPAHQYWQDQAHPSARYAPPPNQYAPQRPSPVFRSQAELGFELPPVRPSVQQKPMPMGVPPPPPPQHRPQSMAYPMQPNSGLGNIPGSQVARSSSASPTRRALPAPATRPVTVTQSSGLPPFPQSSHRTQSASIDFSALSRFNQERMASGIISPSYQQQQQRPPVSFTPPRRRASPPRFFESPTRSRSNSPEKVGSKDSYLAQSKANSQPSPRSNGPEKIGFKDSYLAQSKANSQPRLRSNNPEKVGYKDSYVAQSKANSQPPPRSNSPEKTNAQPRPSQPPIPSSTFVTTSSAAVRQHNPIFEPVNSGLPNTETKFVPLWKRNSATERGRSLPISSAIPGRPLPQPTPTSTRASPQRTVDDEVNSSFDSETNVSEVSAISSAGNQSSRTSAASGGPGILDLKSGNAIPKSRDMDRGRATTTTGVVGNARSRFEERLPQPPDMDRAGATTGVIHSHAQRSEGGGSMTLRFAKMGLDDSHTSPTSPSWPQDLPPLPRGPGSGFGSNRERYSHSHSKSQPQPHSAFAAIGSTGTTGTGNSKARAEKIPDYDLDEPPPRPASASFSTRSISPTGSTASSVSYTSANGAGALERFRRNTQPPAQPQPQYAPFPPTNGGYSGHVTAYAGVKIESPKPLGGKGTIVRAADVRKMEDDSDRDDTDQERGGKKIPKITFGNDDRRESKPEVPRITFGDEDNERPSVPRITFGDADDDDDDDSSSGPMIRITGADTKPTPPKIVFEVPGIGVDSQFGSGPIINVTEEDDDNTPRRKGTQGGYHGGPRALPPAAKSGGSVSQMPGRGKGGLTCPACAKPIVGRVVGAMGMKWHPDCFRCTVCDELLEFQSSYEGVGDDGIKRPYCHLDYHEAFAPRCYHCKTAIVEERFVSLNDPALGRRTYHEAHFFCAECGDPFLSQSSAAKHNHERDFGKDAGGGELAFSGDGTFSYDDEDDNAGFTVYKGHPYCEACHVRLRLPKCRRCKKAIRDHMEAVEALGGKWCWECFRCTNCDQPFEDPSFFERDKKPYCENCFSIIIRNEI